MRKLILTTLIAAFAATGASAESSFFKKAAEKGKDMHIDLIETAIVGYNDYYENLGFTQIAGTKEACSTNLDAVLAVEGGMTFKTKEGIEFRASTDKLCGIWNIYMGHVAKKAKTDKDYMKNFFYFNAARIDYNTVKLYDNNENQIILLKAQEIDRWLAFTSKYTVKQNLDNKIFLFASINYLEHIFNPEKSPIPTEHYYTGTEYREFLAAVMARDFRTADEIIMNFDRTDIERKNWYFWGTGSNLLP